MSEGLPKTLKPPEEELAELKDLQRALALAKENQDADTAESLMEQYQHILEPEASATPERHDLERISKNIEKLFGKDFFGADAVQKVFGIRHEAAQVAARSFPTAELERAKELGQQLIFQTDRMEVKNPDTGKIERNVPITLENLKKYFPKAHDDAPMWYAQDWYNNEEFFKNEKPRTGWRLTSKEVIPSTLSKNYLEQTEILIDYLKTKVFKGKKPKKYLDAIHEFDNVKDKIESDMGSDWQAASKALSELKITKLTRELPVEAMYRLILNDQVNKDKPLPSTYTWTASRDSGGSLVCVGGFDAQGANVRSDHPGARSGHLGSSFSRS